MFLSWRIMPKAITARALIRSQARAIVQNRDRDRCPQVSPLGSGIYVGLAAAIALVGFGLTIVVKRASRPYIVADPNDDV